MLMNLNLLPSLPTLFPAQTVDVKTESQLWIQVKNLFYHSEYFFIQVFGDAVSTVRRAEEPQMFLIGLLLIQIIF